MVGILEEGGGGGFASGLAVRGIEVGGAVCYWMSAFPFQGKGWGNLLLRQIWNFCSELGQWRSKGPTILLAAGIGGTRGTF